MALNAQELRLVRLSFLLLYRISGPYLRAHLHSECRGVGAEREARLLFLGIWYGAFTLEEGCHEQCWLPMT